MMCALLKLPRPVLLFLSVVRDLCTNYAREPVSEHSLVWFVDERLSTRLAARCVFVHMAFDGLGTLPRETVERLSILKHET
jgi:hypothetical protein